MLILTRKPGESIYIGDGIKVVIVEIKGNQIRVGIEAPADVRIYREEIWLQILEENKKAAEAAAENAAESQLKGLSETWHGVPGAKPAEGSGAAKFGSLMRPMGASKPPVAPVVVTRKKGTKKADE